MIPTVHLNGTGRQTLLDELGTASNAVGAAIDAVRQVTVHGRDYYPQGDAAYRQARHEMDERLVTLRKVERELIELYVGVQTQGGRA